MRVFLFLSCNIVRTSTLTGANGRYLRLKPSILPATNRGLNFQPAKLFPVVPGVGSRPGMLWDDCSDYKACKARLIHYLAAKISEQKLNSQIDEERMDSQMEAEKKRWSVLLGNSVWIAIWYNYSARMR